jgi:thioredoxin-like negative regulator of GroEL
VNRLAQDYRGDAYVRYIDIEDSRNNGLVNTYGAYSIPLIVILTDQGEIFTQFRGLTPEANLRAAFDAALAESTGAGGQAVAR